ncbi:MAG TPA: hypothetical protein VFL38_15740 [Humibacillus xanthopallidus]|nr:hypothetical protein [Humibacillus xanthopallidus]
MTNHTWRKPAASVAVIIGLSTLALGACSKTDPATASAPANPQVSAQSASGSDTVELVNAAVDTPTAGDTPNGTDRRGLRARLLRALHATWATESRQGPVTHQAIRGDVTAVSATSITVKAKDGVSMTFAVTADTTVRQRIAGSGKGAKATASTIGAVSVGAKALVTGVGATDPTARVIVHLAAPAAKPSPSATS